jgi:transcriptional regulator with XRE-family HTH domain
MAKKDSSKKKLDPRILEIAEKIKQLRKDSGYTAAESFSYDKGIDRILYWRMEKGTNFTITSLLRILDAHEMSLEEFFTDFEKEKES